jgi:glycosyltransferase involved in cell wall biosynthesis
LPRWLKYWKKGEKGIYLYYIIWQAISVIKAKGLCGEIKFDIVHQLTFGSFWLPTFFSFLRAKFIWGPIGGAEYVPIEFRNSYSFQNRIKETIRALMIQTFPKINPLFWYNCKKAAIIITKTSDTAKLISEKFRHKVKVMVSGGVPFKKSNTLYRKSYHYDEEKIRILSVGRLLYVRNFNLAIQGFSKFKEIERVNSEYIIVGDGLEKYNLEKLSNSSRYSSDIKIVGKKTREEVMQYFVESDIFLFPSIKDAGAWVVFEAMFVGLPIICLDISGFSEIIDNNCGIKIKPESPLQVTDDIADAIYLLAQNRDMREQMGKQARNRLFDTLNWEKKGEKIRNIYKVVHSTNLLKR